MMRIKKGVESKRSKNQSDRKAIWEARHLPGDMLSSMQGSGDLRHQMSGVEEEVAQAALYISGS